MRRSAPGKPEVSFSDVFCVRVALLTALLDKELLWPPEAKLMLFRHPSGEEVRNQPRTPIARGLSRLLSGCARRVRKRDPTNLVRDCDAKWLAANAAEPAVNLSPVVCSGFVVVIQGYRYPACSNAAAGVARPTFSDLTYLLLTLRASAA